MRFRTLQWNIQAARTLEDGKDPKRSASYSGDNPAYFAEIIKSYDPDVVAFQELHKNDERNQIAEIAKLSHLSHLVYDEYEKESFLDPAFEMGQGIASKHELLNHQNIVVKYSKLTDTDEAGTVYYSRNLGVTITEVALADSSLILATTHLPSFGTYGTTEDSEDVGSLRESLDSFLSSLGEKWIFIGDLNVKSKSLQDFLPNTLNQDGVSEILHDSTVPKGFVLDHVLYRNAEVIDAKVDSTVLADHYLLITDFEI